MKTVFASIFVMVKAKPRTREGAYIRYVTDRESGFNEDHCKKT